MSISKQEIDFIRAECKYTRDEFENLMKKVPQHLDEISSEIRAVETWISERCNQKSEKTLIWSAPEIKPLLSRKIFCEKSWDCGQLIYKIRQCFLYDVSVLVWGSQTALFSGRTFDGELNDPPRLYFLRALVALKFPPETEVSEGVEYLRRNLSPSTGTLEILKEPDPKVMGRETDEEYAVELREFGEKDSYQPLLLENKFASRLSWFRWLIDAPVKYRIEGFQLISSLQQSVLDTVLPPNLRALVQSGEDHGNEDIPF